MSLQAIVKDIGSSIVNKSRIKRTAQTSLIPINIITPEKIIHKIYLIEVYQSLLNITLDEKTQQWYDCLNQLFEYCGWFIPFEDVCIVCDHPSKFSLDSENRLHAEGEPAIQFADGYGLYFYHGIPSSEN